jgi:hypothetical protein
LAVSTDIMRTYRAPRQVLREKLARGAREDRALATLMGACFLIFVSRWPVASREAFLDPSVPLEARIGSYLQGIMFFWPLLAYAIAALSHLIAKVFGGRGSWFGARLALFWALLAASPLWLLNGLVEGLIGPGPALSLVGPIAFGAFLVFWGAGLWEAERGEGARTA